ncbi:MAG: hypothetical protein ACUVXJ_17625 [Phycisphaerae bacterium]
MKSLKICNAGDYTATISSPAGDAYVIAQDVYFNTARADIVNLPVIGLGTGAIGRSTYVGQNVSPGDTFTVRNLGAETLNYSIEVEVETDQPWLSATPTTGSSTGEEDPITVSYDCATLPPGTYAGTIKVTDNAINSPKTIVVTVVIETVSPDFNLDGDVDQEDFGHLQACLSGGAAYPTGCANGDLDHNGFVDSADCIIFQRCLSGRNVIANQACDE